MTLQEPRVCTNEAPAPANEAPYNAPAPLNEAPSQTLGEPTNPPLIPADLAALMVIFLNRVALPTGTDEDILPGEIMRRAPCERARSRESFEH
jgi:hypothetical protein